MFNETREEWLRLYINRHATAVHVCMYFYLIKFVTFSFSLLLLFMLLLPVVPDE